MSFLKDALAYASIGLAVFPLTPGSKRPIAGSNGLKDATTDPAKIGLWWGHQYPDANIGVATGAISGTVVLDVDVKPWKGVHGDKTLAALVSEHGTLPPTPEQTTWSGGTQYVFAHAPGVRNSAGRLGPGLDIRGEGGYIVAAPSTVTDDGRSGTYVWVRSPFDRTLAPMPEWLFERIKTGQTTTHSNTTNAPGWADPLVHGVAEGCRDDTCWRLIRRYAAMRPVLSKDEVLGFMLAWARGCDPEFPEADAREKVERAFTEMHTSLVDLPLTDAGNAERMIALYGDRFRWATDREEWLAWDGQRWARGSAEVVKGLALDVARLTQGGAIRLDTEARPKGQSTKRAILKHTLYAESARGIANAVQVAKVLPSVWVEGRALDSRPDLLNVANGTLDLRTFELRAHDPRDLLTRVIKVPYEPTAGAPLWQRFLEDVFCGRQDVIEYVQRAVGYTLTGSITEQCFFLLHGSGANGKSTFVGVLTALMADYATKVEQEAILVPDRRGRGATPELVVFVGKRFAYVDELEEGRQLDEARVKALTGSERGTGRALYEGMREWTNTAKLWLDLNHLPTFTGVDYGIERRPRVIPFDRRFEDHEQDRTMLDRLKAELPGVLAWAVAGCKAWRQRGLDAPEVVSLATRRYRDENNHLPAFMEDLYVKRPGASVAVGALKQEYRGWCAGRDESPLDYQRKVVPFLEQAWKLTRKRVHGGSFVWTGLAQRVNPGEPQT